MPSYFIKIGNGICFIFADILDVNGFSLWSIFTWLSSDTFNMVTLSGIRIQRVGSVPIMQFQFKSCLDRLIGCCCWLGLLTKILFTKKSVFCLVESMILQRYHSFCRKYDQMCLLAAPSTTQAEPASSDDSSDDDDPDCFITAPRTDAPPSPAYLGLDF